MPHADSQSREVTKPEKKFGPLTGGLGVAIWCNTIETEEGQKQFRSLTLSPRRYRDPKSGKWKDASGYRPSDISILQFLLRQAEAYCLTAPLPEAQVDGEAPDFDDVDIPF